MILCPKCNSEEITNTHDAYSLLGMEPEMDKEYMCNICHHLFDKGETECESWYDINNLSDLKISQIVDIVFKDWKKISPSARPYLEAMMSLESAKDVHGSEDGKSILSYFLLNSKQWQGEVAKKVKSYFKTII